MSLPATVIPPKDFRELEWQRNNCNLISPNLRGPCPVPGDGSQKTIVLPFYPAGNSNVSKYVEVSPKASHGAVLSIMRIRKAKPIIPGWLVELKDHYLRGIMDIKSVLEEMDDRTNVSILVRALCKIINVDMDVPVADAEIFQILKRIPKNCDGCYSFPHFIYAIGSPELAKNKRVFMLNTRKFDDKSECKYKMEGRNARCYCFDAQHDKQCGGDRKRDHGDDDMDDEGEEEGGADGCLKPKSEETESAVVPDETGYSLREKVFFSGLLIFEMYDTLKQVESLYRLGKIPEPARKELERNRKRGYGIDDIGKRDFRKAVWDKPLPPLPKTSPYLSTVPFVTSRWQVTETKRCDNVKRTSSKLQALHLAIRPPRDNNENICIIENHTRVRQALSYLAAKGDCVALLPDIHFVIHLSDTAFDKLEVIKTKPSPSCPRRGDRVVDRDNIITQSRRLYQPYRLPCQITHLSSKITYVDGLQLRQICLHMQKQHWIYISQRKLDFRDFVWGKMHVDHMSLGLPRDSFIYAFVTYLPYISHLPIVADNPIPV